MAWNDSGKNSNPWQRKPEQGPPDLDEVIRNLQRRLKGLLGGGGGPRPAGGAGGGSQASNWGLVLLILAIVWLGTGIYQTDAAERAVITRFGRFVRIVDPGVGMHLPWPIERRTFVNVSEFQSFQDRTRMLTADEALVDINLAVQYRRNEPVAYSFNLREPEKTLGEVSESAIREIIGQSKLDFVLETGRQQVSLRTKELIQRTLDAYKSGIEVISVNLQDVSVPEQVAPSQKDAIKAREDKDRLRLAAQTYVNEILPKARGLAASQLQGAEGYKQRVEAEAVGEAARFSSLLAEYEKAPGVTRQRMYYETMESVLGNSSKVLVDGKGAGNMLYLPLDELMKQRGQARMPAVMETAPAIRAPTTDAVETPVDPRQRGDR
jgi:modulator of FtsH protease HflK